MRVRLLLATSLVLCLGTFSRPGLAATGKDTPLPKPASAASQSDGLRKIPPFFGLFGSSELIAKTGFRSSVGRFIEYRVDPKDKSLVPSQTLRIAEVGPAVKGARWIEMVTEGSAGDGQGMRFLARGEKEGNIERVVARVGGMPPMELPLEGLGAEGATGLASTGNPLLGAPKLVGKETVNVPLGQFVTQHWVIESPATKQKLELWTTADEKVPFVGIVKMTMEGGFAVATKVGTDATALISVPARDE